jgi:hypothetical protein
MKRRSFTVDVEIFPDTQNSTPSSLERYSDVDPFLCNGGAVHHVFVCQCQAVNFEFYLEAFNTLPPDRM